MLEKNIQQKIMSHVKDLGGLVWKVSAEGQRGFPDLCIIIRGNVLFLEVKTETGQASNMQMETVRAMRDAGADARIVYGISEAMSYIRSFIPK